MRERVVSPESGEKLTVPLDEPASRECWLLPSPLEWKTTAVPFFLSFANKVGRLLRCIRIKRGEIAVLIVITQELSRAPD